MSNAHFKDVSYLHPAFREIETLFDNGALAALGIKPRWPAAGNYVPGKHSGFQQSRDFAPFEPDKPVTAAEFERMIAILRQRRGPGVPPAKVDAAKADAKPSQQKALSRAQACRILLDRAEGP